MSFLKLNKYEFPLENNKKTKPFQWSLLSPKQWNFLKNLYHVYIQKSQNWKFIKCRNKSVSLYKEIIFYIFDDFCRVIWIAKLFSKTICGHIHFLFSQVGFSFWNGWSRYWQMISRPQVKIKNNLQRSELMRGLPSCKFQQYLGKNEWWRFLEKYFTS